MKNILAYIILSFVGLLNRPLRVLIVSLSLAVISLGFQGTLFQLWQLSQDYRILSAKIKELTTDTILLEKRIKEASSSDYLELEARNRFDMARKSDLIFLFSDKNN